MAPNRSKTDEQVDKDAVEAASGSRHMGPATTQPPKASWTDLDATVGLNRAYEEITERFWVEVDETDDNTCILRSMYTEKTKKKGTHASSDALQVVAQGVVTTYGRFNIGYMWVLNALIAQLLVGWYRAFNISILNVRSRRGRKQSTTYTETRLLGATFADHAWKVRGAFIPNVAVDLSCGTLYR